MIFEINLVLLFKLLIIVLMFEQKYVILETIGKNSQKMTSIVKDKSNNYFIAKKVPIDSEKTMHQISIMKHLKHSNIIAFHEIIEEQNWAFIIEEYCEEGDLEFHLKRQLRLKKIITQETAARWLLQILLALEYLHDLKIIHRDIRPRNIFLTSNGNIKIGSFKASRVLQNETNYAKTLINSPYYLAPELSQGKGYDYKVDIWAFGCVLYQICSLKQVVNLSNIGQLLLKMTKSKFDDLPPNYSKQLNILYHKCMKKSSIQRISAKNLLKTSYFLETMENFIIEKGLNLNFEQKIPIKKYNIHKSKYEKIKIKKKIVKTPQIPKKDALLPQLGIKSHKIQSKGSKSKQKSFTPNFKKTSKEKDITLKQIKNNSNTKEQKSKSLSKQNKKIGNPPLLQVKPEYNKLSPPRQQKTYLLAPPLLPKPTKKNNNIQIQRRSKTRINEEDISQRFQTTLSKQQLKRQLNIFQNNQLHQTNEFMGKIFQNLNLQEQEQQQFQFQFQQQNMLRLTSKKSDETAELLVTFKSKLQQIIEEINYKYCPTLQPIPQKTTEFDSYSFSKIKSFLQMENNQ